MMLDIAREVLLTPYGLSDHEVGMLLGDLQGSSIDYADLYFQYSQSESWLLEDGIVKEAHFHIDQGVGVRAISGVKTGLAYSDKIAFPALRKAVSAARSIVASGQEGVIPILVSDKETPKLYAAENPLSKWRESEKVSLLKAVYAEVLRQDRRIVHVLLTLSGVYEIILVANSENRLAADIRPLVRLNVSV